MLASLSVSIGLLMGGKLLKGRGIDLRLAHEALSLATLAAIVVHALALLGDGYLEPSLADITIPVVSDFERAWTALGIVSGWAMLALGLSYYARRRIGQKRWRTLHRFTALAWLGGVAHGLGEGTDAGETWFLLTVAATVAPALVLLAVRMSGGGRRPARRRPVPRSATG